ncbi:hypothetical protein NIES4073_21100 [Kalymmatonema gypsitolerans NIES-4073]|nr:hypothetical protein NIES4073_21100 [Scytonema sp. NIES-4073]
MSADPDSTPQSVSEEGKFLLFANCQCDDTEAGGRCDWLCHRSESRLALPLPLGQSRRARALRAIAQMASHLNRSNAYAHRI